MTDGSFTNKRGRKAQPPDPDDGPLAEFAHQLWCLKQRAGDPSFAVMREELGAAASRSALAAAARGAALPSWETTWEFVRVLAVGKLGTDPAEAEREWFQRWTAARDAAPRATGSQETPASHSAPVSLKRRRRFPAAIIALAAGLAGITVLVGFSVNWGQPVEIKVWQAKIVGTWSQQYQQNLGVFRYRSPDIPGDTDKSSYHEETVVSIVCQARHRRLVNDPTTGNSSAVWDKLNDEFWIPDLYTDLPKVAGEAPPLGIPLCP